MSIKLFAQACDPREVFGPDDLRWVDFDAARGESLCARYAASIRRVAHDGFDLKLFAGHLGVGKSSELRRLRSMLENPPEGEKPFTVVFVDADELLSVDDVEFPDLIVALAGQVQKTMRDVKAPGFDKLNQYLLEVWDEIKGLLFSKVELSEVEAGVEFFRAAIQFQARSSRAELRKEIEARSTTLLRGLNDLLSVANASVRTHMGSAGLVLIVDGLDRNPGAVRKLLFDRLDRIARIRATAVITVPISLVYDSEFTKVENTLGDDLPPVSMIRLHHADGTRCEEGWDAMRELVAKRCAAGGEAVASTFDSEETRDWLIEMAGGHPRRLVMFLDSATSYLERLPIGRAIAEKVVQVYCNSLVRQIPDECWGPLARIGERTTSLLKDDIHRRMLLNLYIFEYINGGEPWYEVNPVIRRLGRYHEERKKLEERDARGAGA